MIYLAILTFVFVIFAFCFLYFWGINPGDMTVFYAAGEGLTFPAPIIIIGAILIGLLLILQGQLWLGRGSLPSVWQLGQQLQVQKKQNAVAQRANEQLVSELRDLREGLEMVEEQARKEIGMVKPNEIFVQIAK